MPMSKMVEDKRTGSKRWFNEHGLLHRMDGPAIEYGHGDRIYYEHGKLHRLDGPAIVRVNGHQEWRVKGLRHREDGPAFISSDGNREWAFHGKVHRADGPALEWASGDKEWFVNGVRHREGGPAVERVDGMKAWYRNGQLHRDDGPAVEYPNGDLEYRKEGFLHRVDGPAFVRVDGQSEYWLDGENLSPTTYAQAIKRRFTAAQAAREEAAEDPGYVSASANSDDNVVSASFNAAPWFAQASDEEIFALAAVDFCNDYPADGVANHFYGAAGYEDVTRLFDYLGGHPKTMTNEAVGFEVEIDKYQAFAWIKERRPDLFETAVERANEDLAAIEDLITPAERSGGPSP
jgi:hypothetical protein